MRLPSHSVAPEFSEEEEATHLLGNAAELLGVARRISSTGGRKSTTRPPEEGGGATALIAELIRSAAKLEGKGGGIEGRGRGGSVAVWVAVQG